MHALVNKLIEIRQVAIITTGRNQTDGVGKTGAGADQFAGQIEHLFQPTVARGKSQILVIDRQRLGDQVQPGFYHFAMLPFNMRHSFPLRHG